MNDLARELAMEWLTRAEHDLRIAEFLRTMADPPPEGLGFHAQQCAEKALKGFLTVFGVRFERRHDLNYLLDLCVSVDPAFEQFRADADTLTPYAVEFRYPDALTDLALEDALDATETARRIYHFIVAHLP